MESAKEKNLNKNSTIDTSKILETIVNSKNYGKSFIPEIDGRKMLIELLPIEQARAAGKSSDFYQEITSVYNTIMKNLIARQDGIIQGITPTEPIRGSSTGSYSNRKDNIYRRVGPYRGVYGHWK